MVPVIAPIRGGGDNDEGGGEATGWATLAQLLRVANTSGGAVPVLARICGSGGGGVGGGEATGRATVAQSKSGLRRRAGSETSKLRPS